MWKILLGFVIFAALAIFVLTRSGGDVDLSGEKHSVEAPHAASPAPAGAAASSAAPSTPATASPASAASGG